MAAVLQYHHMKELRATVVTCPTAAMGWNGRFVHTVYSAASMTPPQQYEKYMLMSTKENTIGDVTVEQIYLLFFFLVHL